MKRSTRSAAALVGTTVLAGAGIAATVTGIGLPTPAPAGTAASRSPAPASDAALSAAVQELVSRSEALHGRLGTTTQQLHVLERRLRHERRLAEHLATSPVVVAPRAGSTTADGPTTPGGPVTGSAGPQAPRVHATTRASGTGTGPAPSVHTTTRASGSSSPAVHTTTRASGGGAGGEEHETEDGGHDD